MEKKCTNYSEGLGRVMNTNLQILNSAQVFLSNSYKSHSRRLVDIGRVMGCISPSESVVYPAQVLIHMFF